MRKLLTALFVLGLIGVAGQANAQLTFAGGTVDASWDACSPIVANTDPGAVPVSLYYSVLGHTTPHQAYQVWMLVGSETNSLPDAWRFDAVGCEGSSFITIDHLAPAAVVKACPSFQGALPSQQIKAFQLAPPALGYSTTIGNGVLQNAYPSGNSTQIVGTQRYFLARFLFDFTFAVSGPTDPGNTCGGYETPMCVATVGQRTTWLDLSGTEFRFPLGQGTLTFRGGPGGAGCPGVPALNKTWGQIKSQYRN